jgi:hypothetical protein
MARRMELNCNTFVNIPKMLLGQLHIFIPYAGYCINLPKPIGKTTWVESFLPNS